MLTPRQTMEWVADCKANKICGTLYFRDATMVKQVSGSKHIRSGKLPKDFGKAYAGQLVAAYTFDEAGNPHVLYLDGRRRQLLP
jgi:hypothetical protein